MAHLVSTDPARNSRLQPTTTPWSGGKITTQVNFHQQRLSFAPDRPSRSRLLQCRPPVSDRNRDPSPPNMSHESYQSRPSSLDARLHRLSLAKPRNLADDRKWRDSRDYHRWDRSGSPSVSPIGKLLAKDAEWVGQRGTQPISCHRQSSEWETETLMDTASSSLDDGPRTQYPCPFRKRNPVRFNVRVYERCARAPFSSMTELKYVTGHPHRILPLTNSAGFISSPITGLSEPATGAVAVT